MPRNSAVRAEQPEDIVAVRAVNLAAFPTAFAADLVDRPTPKMYPSKRLWCRNYNLVISGTCKGQSPIAQLLMLLS
jgi:predicted N-acetyltransferase YhbS